MSTIGVVIIGRNEGERLKRCLTSLVGKASPIVYVDSGSTDGSVQLATSMGVNVVELDMSKPFTAARSRNAGFERLIALAPDVTYVQYVDGDCEIVETWLAHAAGFMDARPEVAALSGRIRERFPEASVYNRLTDREWDTATGEVHSCAGVSVMRVNTFKAAGGFDPTVAAGEEPEICLRFRNAGHKIVRVPETMALHDVAMHRFAQWWKRQVRGGYGALDVAERFGQHAFKKQVRSAWTWAVIWPALLIASSIAAIFIPFPYGLLLSLSVLALLPLQIARIAWAAKKRGTPTGLAIAYGTLMMVAKLASLMGQLRYRRDKRHGVGVRLIEHKEPAPVPAKGVEVTHG